MGNTSDRELTRRTCVRHTQRLTAEPRRPNQEERQCGTTCLVVLSVGGPGHTPGSRQVQRSSREAAGATLSVDGPRVEEDRLKERDGGRCHSAGSSAKLTNVASTPTIAARGPGRVTLLESRTAIPLSGEHDAARPESPDLGATLPQFCMGGQPIGVVLQAAVRKAAGWSLKRPVIKPDNERSPAVGDGPGPSAAHRDRESPAARCSTICSHATPASACLRARRRPTARSVHVATAQSHQSSPTQDGSPKAGVEGEPARHLLLLGGAVRRRCRRRAGTPQAERDSPRGRRRAGPGRGRGVGGGSAPRCAVGPAAPSGGRSWALAAVLALGLGGALGRRQAPGLRGPVLDSPSDLLQLCGAELVLAPHSTSLASYPRSWIARKDREPSERSASPTIATRYGVASLPMGSSG